MAGLRERKKAATMRHIQNVAIDLFQTAGFDKVSVEQVAEAAQVSPSTIYRYFGTKEGLILRDEYDDRFFTALETQLASGTSVIQSVTAALDTVADEHFRLDQAKTLFRTKLWITHKGVRAASALHLADLSEQLAKTLAATGRYTPQEARVVVNSLANGLITAIFNWYEAGASDPVHSYIADGIAAIARALSEN